MKLVVQIKLLPDAAQAAQLTAYMQAFNAAANHAARAGFEAGVFSQPGIHKQCYRALRDTYGVSSQTAVRAIGKAVECFARDRTVCPTFRPDGAATYDQRSFSFRGTDRVSLLTLNGRTIMPYVVGNYFADKLKHLKGQVDLVYRRGQFYLYATADVPEQSAISVTDYLGIDLGIANLATDSTGERFSGNEVEKHRQRHQTARATFQRRGTRSARRRLRAMSGRQGRYQHQVNHAIAKRLVDKARTLALGIALEDLTHIRERCEKTVGRKQRARLSNWSFAHLRHCITYKARLAGVPVVVVDPRNTSRTCFVCGHCAKGNRKTQDRFVCLACGHENNADHNAAKNIGRLGRLANSPHERRA